MTHDKKVRKILMKMFQDTKVDWKKQIIVLPDKVLDKALSQFKALDKPRIDERKLRKIISVCLGGCYIDNKPHPVLKKGLTKYIAHAIAIKAEECMR